MTVTFDVSLSPAVFLTLGAMLAAAGRIAHIQLTWRRHGVGGFGYFYLVMVIAGNATMAYALEVLGARGAGVLMACTTVFYLWIMSHKIRSWLRNRLKRR